MLYISIVLSIILAMALTYVIHKNISLKVQMQFLSDNASAHEMETSMLTNEKIEYIKKIEQLSSQLKHQEKFIEDFEKLRADSNQSAKAALFDLGNELSRQLIEIHKKENKENREFSEKNIKDTTTRFNAEFERVVNMVGALSKEVSQSKDTVDVIKNSLLSPSGAGSLAEITLENILKSSGLRVTLDFIMQYNVESEDNTILRPDAVIFLPNNKLMVVDAKASKFLVDNQGDLKNLARTMNSHLRSLSSKEYAETLRKSFENKENNLGNVVTLMFLPSEHAIEKVIEADSNFMDKAWKANIFPVGPAGLMNMLSFAKFQISEQLMMYNHQKIIEEVKKLISSVGTMTEHSLRLGSSISNAVSHYDKFAASFNRNFLFKVRNINKMGIDGGLKKTQEALQRFKVVVSKSDLVELEPEKETNEVKKLEEV